MNRKERRALPVASSPWEVALAPFPERLDGDAIDGTLVVADARTRGLRVVGPAVPGRWDAVLALALEMPVSGRPERPRVVRCAPHLLERLRRCSVFAGARVEVGPTPAADAVARPLRPESPAPPPAPAAPEPPGLRIERAAFRTALIGTWRGRPWEFFRPDDQLRFVGAPALEDTVVSFVGRSGGVPGFAVFPNPGELARATRFGSAVHRMCALTFRRRDEALPRHHAALEGWWFGPDDDWPWLVHSVDGEPRPADDALQRVVLAVCQALSVRTGNLVQWTADTVLGRVVATTRDVDEWIRGAWRAGFYPDGRLWILQSRAHAERTARDLELGLVSHVSVSSAGIEAWGGFERLGLLPLRNPAVRPGSDRLSVVVLAGGARRGRPEDAPVVAEHEVALGPAEPPFGRRSARGPAVADAVFHGPPDGWPRASDTLNAFVSHVVPGPVLAGADPAELRRVWDLAADVFTAVSFADHAGQWSRFDALPVDDPLVTAFRWHKRAAHHGDPRWFVVDGVTRAEGRVGVGVRAGRVGR